MQMINRKQNTQADVVELSDVLESDDFHFDDVPSDGMHSYAGNQNRPIDRSLISDAFRQPPVNQPMPAGNRGAVNIGPKSAALLFPSKPDTEQDPDDEEEEEHREKMRFYSNLYTVLGIIIGVAAILVISALLAGLINWLRYDILHSAFLLQNSL